MPKSPSTIHVRYNNQVRRTRPAPFSVGRHAVVYQEPARVQGLEAVLLTDEGGTKKLRALTDGQEVEMLAWRVAWQRGPRTLYNVRCISDGAVGWVWAEFLRSSQEPRSGPRFALQPGGRGAGTERRRDRSRVAPEPSAKPKTELSTLKPSGNERPVPCPVCGGQVHPYNLWGNSKGKVVGCYLCHGKRP